MTVSQCRFMDFEEKLAQFFERGFFCVKFYQGSFCMSGGMRFNFRIGMWVFMAYDVAYR